MTAPTMADKVLVVGNGIAAWAIAVALAEAGFPTRLLDAGQSGTAATLRNEGWLHAGTYHAISQATDEAAFAVAERTQRGGRAILAQFPEALERASDRSIALVANDLDVDFVRGRWGLCGVDARSLTLAQTRGLLPEVDLTTSRAAFLVADQAINTALLIDRLRNRFERAGGKVKSGAAVALVEDGIEIRKPNGAGRRVTPALTVWAAGYSGIHMVAPLLAEHGLTPRLWRSHLLVSEPVSRMSWFELQPGGLGHMHHDTHAVVGLNDDAVDITHLNDPGNTGDSEAARAFRSGLDRLGLPPVLDQHARVVSCTKVDLASSAATTRDLNLRAVVARPGLLVALPGKMTEAPVLATEVTALAVKSLRGADLATRLGDRWCDAQVILSHAPALKAATVFSGNTVTKVHRDERAALLEARIHADLTDTSLVLAPLASVSTSTDGTSLTYQRIPSDGSTSAPVDIEGRVAALVEFQRRYRIGESPLTLYRDAAGPNMLEAGGALWQVDLSSCGQIRHQLDDLALLIETCAEPGDAVVELYRQWWNELEAVRPSSVVAGLAEVGVRFVDLLDSAYRNYEAALHETSETETWDRAAALVGLADLSMVELRWADLAWFRSFRTARVRQKLGDRNASVAPTQQVMA